MPRAVPIPPVLTVADAAQRKHCTGQAIRNAIARGALNAVRLGERATVVLDDAAFAAFTIRETGGRTHRAPEATPSTGTADAALAQ